MKLITSNQQHEAGLRLIALRRILDHMNEEENFKNGKYERWADCMEYIASNILDLANIVGGVSMMSAIKLDLDKQQTGDK